MLNTKVYVCLGLAFCVIEDIEAYDWDLDHLNSVVQSHTQSLRRIHESLRRTDHIWNWFNSNVKLVNDLVSEKRRDKNDDVTYKFDFTTYAREIQTNFSQELKREMSDELDRRYKMREANISKEELDLLKLDIKSVNETCANTVSKVAEYSRRIVSSTNSTVQNGISEMERMRLQLHGVIESLSNAQKKIDFIESRMRNIETKLEDLLLNKIWDFKNEKEPSSIPNMHEIEGNDISNKLENMHNYSNEFVMRRIINELVQKNVAEINLKLDILTSQFASMDILGGVLNRSIEKGEPGSQGPRGFSGPRGPKGEKGNMGQGGLPGVGQKGDKGSIGLGGLPGVGQKGVKGSMGLDGLPGPVGSPGVVGLPGIGQKGDKGSVGRNGLSGPVGSPGIGQKGDKGSMGPDGLPGIGK